MEELRHNIIQRCDEGRLSSVEFEKKYTQRSTTDNRQSFGIRHLVILLAIWMAPALVNAQAWTMPRGEAYVKFFYGKVTAAERYTFDGRATDYISGLAGDTFRDRSLYVYSELGLSDQFSLIFSAPYKRTFVRDHAFRFRIFGFGNISLGGRLALFPLLGIESKQGVLAVNTMLSVPAGYTRNYTPSTGAGQIDLQGSLFYGHSFSPLPAYSQVGIGYRHRSSWYWFSQYAPCRPGSDIHCIAGAQPDQGDEWLLHAEAGLSPLRGLVLLQILGAGIWSLKKPAVGFSAINPIPTHQRYIKLGAGVTIYPLRKLQTPLYNTLGLSLQYFETIFGRNTIKSTDLFVGVEIRPSFF